MCSRFRGVKSLAELPGYFDYGPHINFQYNPNIAPTEIAPMFMSEKGEAARVVLASFGIPQKPRADGKKRTPLINSRTDKLRQGVFADRLKNRHCIIPAEGFYEWRDEGGQKQPYYFHRADDKPILFVGLWEMAEVKGDNIPVFSILTDEPNDLTRPYHDRMPVIVDDPLPWLEMGGLGSIQLVAPEVINIRPVNRAVNPWSEKSLANIETPQARSTFL